MLVPIFLTLKELDNRICGCKWINRFHRLQPCAESGSGWIWKRVWAGDVSSAGHSLLTEALGGEPGLHLGRWRVIVQGGGSVGGAGRHQRTGRASSPSQPLYELIVDHQDCTNTELHEHTHADRHSVNMVSQNVTFLTFLCLTSWFYTLHFDNKAIININEMIIYPARKWL